MICLQAHLMLIIQEQPASTPHADHTGTACKHTSCRSYRNSLQAHVMPIIQEQPASTPHADHTGTACKH